MEARFPCAFSLSTLLERLQAGGETVDDGFRLGSVVSMYVCV